MNDEQHVVIVGGGMAGGNAAVALREEGFGGRVTILGQEQEWPYERPPLSKGYLRGEEELAKAYVRQPADYETLNIDVRRGVTVTGLDLDGRSVATDAGNVAYDALVLATGAEPRRLNVPGADLPGVRYLRSVEDADGLRIAAQDAENIVVIGGGWIGAEVTASLRHLGRPVTFLTSRPRPLEHVLGREIAEVYRQAHLDHGVLLAQGRIGRIVGTDRVTSVETVDAQRFPGDLVVVGVGAAPRSSLASAAGLRLDGEAIAVDDHLRTSAPNIYAIGDVASAWNPRYGRSLHLEHWDNAIHHGKAVAANIVGRDVAYDRVPYLYSDQYDVGMEYRGFAHRWDQVVVRGDLATREFHAFWLREGRVAAAMNVNLWDDGDALQALVESGAMVEPRQLSDPQVPLAKAA